MVLSTLSFQVRLYVTAEYTRRANRNTTLRVQTSVRDSLLSTPSWRYPNKKQLCARVCVRVSINLSGSIKLIPRRLAYVRKSKIWRRHRIGGSRWQPDDDVIRPTQTVWQLARHKNTNTRNVHLRNSGRMSSVIAWREHCRDWKRDETLYHSIIISCCWTHTSDVYIYIYLPTQIIYACDKLFSVVITMKSVPLTYDALNDRRMLNENRHSRWFENNEKYKVESDFSLIFIFILLYLCRYLLLLPLLWYILFHASVSNVHHHDVCEFKYIYILICQ